LPVKYANRVASLYGFFDSAVHDALHAGERVAAEGESPHGTWWTPDISTEGVAVYVDDCVAFGYRDAAQRGPEKWRRGEVASRL
jgi:hypothetical protein